MLKILKSTIWFALAVTLLFTVLSLRFSALTGPQVELLPEIRMASAGTPIPPALEVITRVFTRDQGGLIKLNQGTSVSFPANILKSSATSRRSITLKLLKSFSSNPPNRTIVPVSPAVSIEFHDRQDAESARPAEAEPNIVVRFNLRGSKPEDLKGALPTGLFFDKDGHPLFIPLEGTTNPKDMTGTARITAKTVKSLIEAGAEFYRRPFEVGFLNTAVPDGTTRRESAPVLEMTDVKTDIKAEDLSVGDSHICLLDKAGSSHCVGGNGYGILGNDSTESSLTFVKVKETETFTKIAATDFGMCALTKAGAVKCWGHYFTFPSVMSTDGKFYTGQRTVPTSIVENKGWVDFRLAVHAICGLSREGQVECLVYEGGTKTSFHRPLGAIGKVTDFSFSSIQNGCAVVASGAVKCWHADPQRTDRGKFIFSVEDVPGIIDASLVRTNDSTSCVVHRSGKVSCWNWTLPNQVAESQNSPQSVKGLENINQLELGSIRACAIDKKGTAFCWDLFPKVTAPTRLQQGEPFKLLRLSLKHTCAISRSGALQCWGEKIYLQ